MDTFPAALLIRKTFHTHTHTHTHTGRNLANTKWYNELGSTMVINDHNLTTGVFNGLYSSAVGEAEKQYILVGRTDTEGTTVGWTVVYQNDYLNAHSTCTWSGQFQTDELGNPVIPTTWLLTAQTTPPENWDSTNVGFDHFTEIPPSAADIERAKLRCKRSHPKNA